MAFKSNALIACSMLLPLANVLASTAANQLEEVVVTASRTGETLLNQTPLAITVHDAKGLNELGIGEIEDLARYTPGLNISENTNLTQIYIRGIGTNNVFVGSDPSTPIHIDGVYIARPLASSFDLLNIERVEVLKGPQGTLYGRNATGGTINIITRTPDADPYASVSVDAGSFNKRRLLLQSGGALVDDSLYGNISFLHHRRDGYVDNVRPEGKSELSDEDRLGAAAGLRWSLAEESDLLFKADYFSIDESGTSFKPSYLNRDGSQPQGGTQGTVIKDFHTVAVPFSPNIDVEQYGVSGRYTHSFSEELQLTLLTAYRNLDGKLIVDVDWTDAEAVPVPDPITRLAENQDQWSQEILLNGHSGQVTWVGGLYYFQEKHESQLQPNAPANLIDSALKWRSYAVFANATWEFAPRWGLQLGGRYNIDEKDFDSDVTLGGSFLGTVQEDESWSEFMPRAGVDYQWSEQVLLYSTISKGYKSGGYNPTSFPFAPFSTSAEAFDPEEVWAYELGWKAEYFDRRLNLRTALFYYDYSDIQIQNFLGAGMVEIANAGEVESYGGEVETEWRPNAAWTLLAGVNYLNAEFQNGATAQGVLLPAKVSISGNRTPVSPQWTAHVGVVFEQTLSRGSLRYRIDGYAQTREYYSSLNDEVNSQDDYELLSARISFVEASQRWQVSLYGDNLTDTEYSGAGADFNNRGVIRSIQPPRTWGVQLVWNAY